MTEFGMLFDRNGLNYGLLIESGLIFQIIY